MKTANQNLVVSLYYRKGTDTRKGSIQQGWSMHTRRRIKYNESKVESKKVPLGKRAMNEQLGKAQTNREGRLREK